MGLKNNRAICPNCGGKIHTQGKGIGALTIAASGPLVRTGHECQHCGVPLTGKVTLTNYAVIDESRRTPAPAPSPPPANESRDAYLARINATKLGTPKKKRR